MARVAGRRLGAVRRGDAAGAARRAHVRPGSRRSRLPLVLRDRSLLANFPQAYNYGRPVFRGIYEDNDPQQAADGDGQLQHRRLAVLGMVRSRAAAVRRHERGVQARRQLLDLRPDALTAARARLRQGYGEVSPKRFARRRKRVGESRAKPCRGRKRASARASHANGARRRSGARESV